jgi:hypothetical protein
MTDLLPLIQKQLESTNNTLQLLSNQISSEININTINTKCSIKDLSNLYKLSSIVSGNKTYAIDTLSKIIAILKTSQYCTNNVITINSHELDDLMQQHNISYITCMRILSANKILFTNKVEYKNNKFIKRHYVIFLYSNK